MDFYAHQQHKLADHLNEVGRRAAEFAEKFQAELHGSIAGLLHDLGKAEEEFQKRIRTNDDQGEKQPHAHHGAMLALEAEAWPIAFAINGHHAGLHNRDKLPVKRLEYLPKAKQSASALHESDSSWSLPKIKEKLPRWVELLEFDQRHTSSGWFAAEFFTRFLFSSLIDADRLDTEEHEKKVDAQQLSPAEYQKKWGRTNLRHDWPQFDAERWLEILRADLQQRFETAQLEEKASPEVLAIRKEVGGLALEKAKEGRGLFSLAGPTGGGKTLNSMLFALAHAAHHNSQLPDGDPRSFRRVIIVIPYLSIIEQTVNELVKVFGDDFILEHHSQAEEPKPEDFKKEKADGRFDVQTRRRRLAAENWDAPVIVTTSVQFFNSLFSRRPGKARKLHNICQSVVIFDEVQTLPPLLLPPLLNALNELSNPERPYGCSMVFCTATQPALEESEDLLCGLRNIRPIVPSERAREHFLQLARVEYEWPQSGQAKSWDRIAQEMLATSSQQALAIVNTRRHARELHHAIKGRLNKDEDGLFHLSTWMMPSHRREVLAEVRRRLGSPDKPPCLLVSTQCIEAGVDVDFPEAWRAFGPYDSIVQAAGRCNRNGKAQKGLIHVFVPEDENYPPGIYSTATQQTRMFRQMRPDKDEPHNPDSFPEYFRLLYQLSVPDECAIQKARAQFHFEEVDQLFKLIEENTVSVLILSQMIDGIYQETAAKAVYDAAERRGFFLRDDWRKMQSCILNIPFHSKDKSPYQENLKPVFEKESGLLVWTGIYRGGLNGYGLDFDTFSPEEMIL